MRAFGLALRGTQVALLMLAAFLIWLIGWVALLVAFRPRAVRRAWFAERLTALLRALGATYVKVGQIMSTRPDIFPPHIIRALETLQDRVGGFAFHHVEATLTADFGRPPAELYASLEATPIASASVAQVHRATLPDGRTVAVKVRRPGIEVTCERDLAIMVLVARVIALLPPFRLAAPVETVEEFGRAIRMQIDLTIEAANNRRFRQLFAADPDLVFPELVPELCSARVVTMTFIDGAKILEADRTRHDPARLARIGFRTLLEMVFEHGFVHADLHPGNIFVTADDKVALLDLGLVAELDDTHRRTFAAYFAAWAAGDARTMARIMTEFSPSSKVPDYAAYEAEVLSFAERYLGKPLGEVEATRVAFDMFGILRRHRVRVNATFTMCNIAIAVTEGLGKQLDPSLDLMNEALPFFFRLKAEGKL
jgi:ubiquinone biosynthesis protein